MNYNLSDLVDSFINQKINLKTYIDLVENLKITNKQSLQDFFYKFKTDHDIDKSMNALLILWLLNYDYLKDLKNDSNIYISYFVELASNINSSSLEIVFLADFLLVARLDELYFIINHDSHENEIDLPNVLQYASVYCYNCNDNMNLNDKLLLPEFSFYVFQK